MKPFLIVFNGPAAGGKTAVAKRLWGELPRTALIELDAVKWLVSEYKSDDFDLRLASKVGLEMAKAYLSAGISVIVEKAFCRKEYLLPFLSLAKRKKIRAKVYNLEAPWAVIEKRVKTRGHAMTREKARRIFVEYSRNLFQVDKTFDTSRFSIKQVVAAVKKDALREP
ncbi:AAA family ATPase [Candidatus Micrarchaeota archaeon]|nr:AAA family ATPase [Candidatus Micrarchaeota archaeon]